MQRDLVFEFFTNRIVCDLDLYNGPRELYDKHLSISLKGSAMEWRTKTNGTLSGKTTFR